MRTAVCLPEILIRIVIVVIGNLDLDVPACLDFRLSATQPRVILLANDGWEEICESHEAFLEILNKE